MSFSQKIYTIVKAHQDAVKSLIYNSNTKSILSGGLDKSIFFWKLEEENRNIFENTPVIEENEEIEINEESQENILNQNNVSSLNEISGENQTSRNMLNLNYKLIKEEKIETDRILEMQVSSKDSDFCYILTANNKSIHRMTISSKKIITQYIQENEDIMSFCINSTGTLLITSLIGTFPCFHLWMIDHTSFVGDNPLKMFSEKQFLWKTSKFLKISLIPRI